MIETDAFAESYHAFRDAILSSFGVPRHVLLGEPPPMTPEQAFMQAIIENPDDDTPRLVFADYLEEHGEDSRAEFIRVQVELAKLPIPEAKTIRPFVSTAAYHEGEGICVRCTDDVECHYHALRRREKELLEHVEEWHPTLVGSPVVSNDPKVQAKRSSADPFDDPINYLQSHGWKPLGNPNSPNCRWQEALGPVWLPDGDASGSMCPLEFRRGFVAEITLTCADWLQHRDALLQAAPLEMVTLTDAGDYVDHGPGEHEDRVQILKWPPSGWIYSHGNGIVTLCRNKAIADALTTS